MIKFLKLAAFLFVLSFPNLAEAAACYWVGTGGVAGGGTWSATNGVNWASSSGGANSTCAATGGVPKNATDVAHFDAHANGIGGNTVTMDASMDGTSFATINTTLMTGGGHLNLNGRNFTLTSTFSGSGTGTRSITCGASTITFTVSGLTVWDFTNTSGATISCASATYIFAAPSSSGGAQIFNGGTSQTYGTLTVNGRTNGTEVTVAATTGITFATVNINGAVRIIWQQTPAVITITSALNLTGTSTGLVEWSGSNTNAGVPMLLTLTGATVTASWLAIKNTTITGGTIAGTAIFNLGGTTNVTGSAPPSGGGGKIIGG